MQRRRSAWFAGLIGIAFAGTLLFSQVATNWPLPAFAYGLTWGSDFWYGVPPWTAFHAIWSFFGAMTYGARANQWIAFVLACAIYAIPYLASFVLFRWLSTRIGRQSKLGAIRVFLVIVSRLAIVLWAVLMLTGAAAMFARAVSFIRT